MCVLLALWMQGAGVVEGGAHLVCYNGPAGGARVCCNDDAAVKEGADNGCAGAGGLWQWHTLGVEGGIAVVVGEVEAAHGGVGAVVWEWMWE